MVAALGLACTKPEPPVAQPTQPPAPPVPVAIELDAAVDVAVDAAPDAPQVATVDALVIAPAPEVWLKGSTHVHAKPSGDSATPVEDVIAWYQSRGYDFIALTDHNRISEVGATTTVGQVAVRAPAAGLIVLAGIELTFNPSGCVPAGEGDKCRIHVNLLGPTARPPDKLEWADRKTKDRVAMYQAAIAQQQALGGIAQINHPQWFWGMTAEVLTELARRGMPLVEIANVQFATWNAGDPDHPSTEALWDAALAKGVMLWGVASDDAHHYNDPGTYPAGGGWVMVRARRDPQAILDALAAGRFYASTGVALARAEVVDQSLVVEVAPGERGPHAIAFIENGKQVAKVNANTAVRVLPSQGYLRAVVTRGDGKQAWVQPARRP